MAIPRINNGRTEELVAMEKVSFQSRSGQPTPDIPLEMDDLPKIEKVAPNSNILPHSDESGEEYYLGDMYSGIARDLWEIDTDERPYLKYVKSISDGWPHLRWLADFMEVGTSPVKWKFLTKEDTETRAKRTRVAMLDFSPSQEPSRKDIQSSEKLSQLLNDPTFNHDPKHARIFIVEDLSRDVIEAFGAKYDVDPLFWRNQISDYTWYNTRDPWVELNDLGHITSERNFFTMRYMRPRYFRSEESINEALKELGGFNVLRRMGQDISYEVRKLRKRKDATVGVIRSKASLWLRNNTEGEKGALGILVVDPTMSEGFPLWGGPRNLSPSPSMYAPIPPSPPRTSLFEDLIHYTLSTPNSTILSLQTAPSLLALPILNMVAAEWSTVISYITTGLTKIEWELESPAYRDSSFGLDGALDRLHPLRRFIPVYRMMLTEILSSILSPTNLSPTDLAAKLAPLRSDFTSLLRSLDMIQTRTQDIISLATAIISIEENKRAMKMNINLVRVTYLAVVFVPMAFVSSFFSMTPNLKDLEQTFWIYFAISIPLTLLCLIVADQGRAVGVAWRWLWGKKKGRAKID